MLSIEIYSPTGKCLHSQEVEAGQYRIGRSLRSDIRIKHDAIGRHQAVLEESDGGWTIRNRDDGYGMWKDGARIGAYGPLRPGDVLVLGDCELHVLMAGNAWQRQQSAEHSLNGRAATTPAEHDATPTSRSALPEEAEESPSADAHEPVQAPSPGGDERQDPATGATDPDAADDAVDDAGIAQRLALKRELRDAIVRAMDLYSRGILNELSSEALRQEAWSATEHVLNAGEVTLPPDVEQNGLIEEVVAEAVGYGPLEPLLSDDSITEVMVNGPDRIYVEQNGRLREASQAFSDEDALLRVIERIVTSVGRRIDEGQPLVDARLPDGSRVNAIIRPLSLVGACLTIRKFNKAKMSLDELVERGALSQEMAEFLKNCVRYRKNVVVSGGTGSGKTTFLNALSEHIPENERIVTIEDAAELRLEQRHVISLEARPPNVEGKGEIPIRELVRNSLRMRPDRIIVGECRGGEALDMLQAMNTGHDGSLTTGHANAPRDLLSRLEVMVLMAGMDLPVRAIREQIASAVDIVVQQARLSDGTRRITSIQEIGGLEGDVILMQKLFEFQQQGIDADGNVIGHHRGFGFAPAFYEELRQGGIELDRSVFGRQEE